jgi:AcrR family transcriptional regulator
MATEVTRARILDAAERLFAEHGYAGASVRRITADAQADLGAVRYHFGSKDGLFGAVLQRRLEPLCERRLALLDDVESRSAPGPASIEDVIRAFLEPALALTSDAEHGRHWIKLMGRVRIEPGDYLLGVQLPYRELLERFLGAIRRALPALSEDDLAYRFYFLFGAEINTLIDDGTLRAMRPGLPNIYEDPEAVVSRLVDFCAAGLRAPADSSALGDAPSVRGKTAREEVPGSPSRSARTS